jgi:ubiquinol-cytochrome c reductase cytochrome c subunit
MKRLVILLAFLVIPSVFAQAQSAGNSGNVDKGKQAFERMLCSACHGHEGQGGAAGARIGVKPPVLPAFIAYVRRPAGGMPPFTAKVVSDADLTDIHAYLASRPAPPPLKDIPLLNQ